MKKVAINKWEKLLANDGVKYVTDTIEGNGDEELEVEIKVGLTIEERMAFTKKVVKASFDTLDGSFIPYAAVVAYNMYLIDTFTNLNVGKDLDKVMNFIGNTNVICLIKDHNKKLINDLVGEVEDAIEWEKQHRCKSGKVDELCDGLNILLDHFVHMMDQAEEKIQDGSLEEMFNNVKENFGKLGTQVSDGDASKVIPITGMIE